MLHAQNTPGGQLVQATDQFVGVRGARLVMFDDEGVRAAAMASWLAMMGWEVAVLTDAFTHQWTPTLKQTNTLAGDRTTQWTPITAEQVKVAQTQGARVIDVRASTKYRQAHIQESVWSIRPHLHRVPALSGARIVLIADDAMVAHLAALELEQADVAQIQINMDCAATWQAAGLNVVATPDLPTDHDSIDYLFFVHDRHDGNRAAAQRYLDWEVNLLNQIDEQERSSYRLPH